jgi:hypothetical protein
MVFGSDASLVLPDWADRRFHVALDCRSLTTDRLVLPSDVPGIIDLRQAVINVLDIPAGGLRATMRLSGLTYKDLDPDPDPPIGARLKWLRRDPDGYHPQPYEQLAAYYRTNGNDREARLTLLGKRRVHRVHATRLPRLITPVRQLLSAIWRIPGWIIDALAGYGYVPSRAFAWLITSVAVGAWLLYPDAPDGPTESHVGNAVLLAIDSIIPTSPFGLRSAATLTGGSFVAAVALQAIGFALSIAVLPAVTRTLARADK